MLFWKKQILSAIFRYYLVLFESITLLYICNAVEEKSVVSLDPQKLFIIINYQYQVHNFIFVKVPSS